MALPFPSTAALPRTLPVVRSVKTTWPIGMPEPAPSFWDRLVESWNSLLSGPPEVTPRERPAAPRAASDGDRPIRAA